MKVVRGIFVIALVAIIVAGVILRRHSPPVNSAPESVAEQPASTVDSAIPSDAAPANPLPVKRILPASPRENIYPATGKLARLRQIQEQFRALAAGDPAVAMRAAKQVTNDVEREAALLTLVMEWTHGELDLPMSRARRMDTYGIEYAFGCELTNQPELALTWASELTSGQGRTELLQAVARGMIRSDPVGAFALIDQAPEADRRRIFDTLIGDWASHDTAAALQWAEQIPNPADRDAAIQTIRTVAPVGIGAGVAIEDGHPIIKEILPGTPAGLSGQLLPGDRLLAVAQGNNQFVDVQNIPLTNVIQMIRGNPGTPVQLEVLSTSAPPNSLPRTVYLYRDQIKLKN
jgi:hypothetical protein